MNQRVTVLRQKIAAIFSCTWHTATTHKATILAVVTILFASVSVFNDGFDLVKNHIVQKRAEDGLEKLNSGVSIKHVEAIFGAPIAESKIDVPKKLRQYIYSFQKFYLQVVFDEENTVQFFAVTSKTPNFRPTIPYIGNILGEKTFAEVGGGKMLQSNLSSKFYEYAEFIYLGNPGNYRNLYLAYNPSGILYKREPIWPSFEKVEDKKAIEQFRLSAYPNTYGVGSTLGDDEHWVAHVGVGIDFYLSRDLPEHHY